jgi:hypothetical protein
MLVWLLLAMAALGGLLLLNLPRRAKVAWEGFCCCSSHRMMSQTSRAETHAETFLTACYTV